MMNEQLKSPKITKLSWGEVEVEGFGKFKDVKLYPGGARAWDWGETGTEHSPGVQLADVEELLDQGAEVIVLTLGVLGRLKVMAETVAEMEARGISLHIRKTNQAVEIYNQLVDDQAVGALIHSTC
jgi:hypothetical protein